MPRQPEWVSRIAEIRQDVQRVQDLPFIGRQSIELFFGLHKRQALRLMQQIGCSNGASGKVVEPRDILDFLRRIEELPDTARILRRLERVGEEVAKSKENWQARQIKIAVAEFKGIDDLEGVSFAPGRLLIEHAGCEDLLTRLFSLVQAISANFPRFQALAVTTPPETNQRPLAAHR